MTARWTPVSASSSGACAPADDTTRQLKAIAPSAILLDVNMPGTDGGELCVMIRLDYPRVRCPILFVMSNRSTDVVVEARRVGVTLSW